MATSAALVRACGHAYVMPAAMSVIGARTFSGPVVSMKLRSAADRVRFTDFIRGDPARQAAEK
jgi:hypothetical protein